MTAPLTDQQLDEIETRAAHLHEYAQQHGDGEGDTLAGEDVPALVDAVRRLRAENAQLRAARNVIASMHRDLDARHDAVAAFLDEQERAARAFELPTPAWVEAVRAASVPPAAPLSASPASSVSESAQSPTGAAEGPRRALTPNEYDAAWHAVEGAAGDEGADPGTVLHAVLDRLGIQWQDAAQRIA